tara:strand:+ start:1144 stop:1869 length:726 start_codon:yes stop_codon:yes gene_type:complete
MKKVKLGVNIDHVATVRNARGELYPSPLRAALLSEKYGADSITIHLREDRRHIRDKDLKLIKARLKIPLNLEMAATNEMLRIATREKPEYVCIVPEKRQEITTEGGLNLNHNKIRLKQIIKKLKIIGIRVSLFIEPNVKDIKLAKFYFDSNCIEIHTGKICNKINLNKPFKNELIKIKNSVNFAHSIGLEVHAGHGINFKSCKVLSKVKNIQEFNIGHFLVGESIFSGLKDTIKKFNKIIK